MNAVNNNRLNPLLSWEYFASSLNDRWHLLRQTGNYLHYLYGILSKMALAPICDTKKKLF